MIKAIKITNYEGDIYVDNTVVLKYHATARNGRLSYINQDIVDFNLYRKNRTVVNNELFDFEDKIMEEVAADEEWINPDEEFAEDVISEVNKGTVEDV